MNRIAVFALSFAACTFGVAPVDPAFDDAGDPVVDGATDLSVTFDLAPPLDFTTPPDLTRVPTYAADVQPDVSAMGCDSNACHGSTNASAPKPVLLAMPSGITQVTFNYGDVLPYASKGTWLSRPLQTSGGTHPKFFSSVADARYVKWALWVQDGEMLQ